MPLPDPLGLLFLLPPDDAAPKSEGDDRVHEHDPPIPIGAVVASSHLRGRTILRARVRRNALRAHRHQGHMHYTQGAGRWDGIAHRRSDYPRQADCSAFATWCYWLATRNQHPADFVNGEHWKAGYTGTMTRHGHQVPASHLRVGDLVFYGGSHSIPEHVAVHVGHQHVVSFGGPGGPYLLPVRYRSDLNHCRAYL